MDILHHANSYDTVNHALLLAGNIRQRMRRLLAQAPSLRGAPVDDYQEFYYAPGRLDPFGDTQRKLEGLPFFQEGFAGRSYLDLGCNAGFFVTLASLKGAGPAMGLDVSGPTVLKSRRIAEIAAPGRDIRFVEGRLPTHPFGREFDVVSAFSLVHHLYQDKANFGSLHAVLCYLASLTADAAIVEFVTVAEGNAYEYPSLVGDPDYNVDNFVTALSSLFSEVRCANNHNAPHKKVYLGLGRRRP